MIPMKMIESRIHSVIIVKFAMGNIFIKTHILRKCLIISIKSVVYSYAQWSIFPHHHPMQIW